MKQFLLSNREDEMSEPIRIVAALIRDESGRVLLVRKRGTAAFMQPGGKRDPGEDDVTALARELNEELGCRVVAGTALHSGRLNAWRQTSRNGRSVRRSIRSTSAATSRRAPRSTKSSGS